MNLYYPLICYISTQFFRKKKKIIYFTIKKIYILQNFWWKDLLPINQRTKIIIQYIQILVILPREKKIIVFCNKNIAVVQPAKSCEPASDKLIQYPIYPGRKKKYIIIQYIQFFLSSKEKKKFIVFCNTNIPQTIVCQLI